MNYLFFAVQALIGAAGVLLLRSNLDGFHLRNLTSSSREAIPIIIGIFLYALSFIMWLIILSKVKVSIAYPVTIGLTLVFTLIGAKLFLKESLNPQAALGVAMIVIGVILGGSKGV